MLKNPFDIICSNSVFIVQSIICLHVQNKMCYLMFFNLIVIRIKNHMLKSLKFINYITNKVNESTLYIIHTHL